MASLLTWALANWKWVVIAALVLALGGQQLRVSNAKSAAAQAHIDLAGYKTSVAESTRILQAANDRKAAENNARQLEATNAARTREAALRDDAAGARSELDRLRNAVRVASSRNSVPGTAPSASDQYAATQGVVFLECAAAFGELARAAGGHASDVQTLTESWPR